MSRGPVAGPPRLDPEGEPGLLRLRWLRGLRWAAVLGIVAAALLSAAGAFPGVAWPVLLAVACALALSNHLLEREDRAAAGAKDPWTAPRQVAIDLCALTLVLWASGGLQTPFVSYYAFHVVLSGILVGPRASALAAGASLLGVLFLELTRALPVLAIAEWAPVEPWGTIAGAAALATTLGGIAYIVRHAVRELRVREQAVARAKEHLALEYELLTHTPSELDAGLEVVDEHGRVVWRNRRAEEIAPAARGEVWACPGEVHHCEADLSGECPVGPTLAAGEPGRCRFAVRIRGAERVYELMRFPLVGEGQGMPPRVLNLYLDRTEATLDERRLVTTERLVSLGRVAQGVAHELNTPLATIRTLAADMRAAVRALRGQGRAAFVRAVEDLDESAALIQDETRRLGRITQALLAGGDLVRTRVDGAVPLAAVVERARALVFAGVRGGPSVEIGEGVERLAVAADPDRLVQVLVNLLQNAYDAVRERPDGHVFLVARVHDGQVEVCVEDDGPGLSPDVAAHLFEPFTTTKPPGQGTGLGLYTSFMLVRAMGGTLTMEGRDEGGVRAVVRLPAANLALAPLPAAAQRAG